MFYQVVVLESESVRIGGCDPVDCPERQRNVFGRLIKEQMGARIRTAIEIHGGYIFLV